ncbi:hypothetical protein D3C86_2013410 [compost metagenome]
MRHFIPKPYWPIQLSQIIAEQVRHGDRQITRLLSALQQGKLGQHIQGIEEKVRVHLILQHLELHFFQLLVFLQPFCFLHNKRFEIILHMSKSSR